MKPEKHYFNPPDHADQLKPLLQQLDKKATSLQLQKLLRRYPKCKQGYFSKNQLLAAVKYYHARLKLTTPLARFVALFQKKPTRSHSGVTVVTVLTKPFPCPGRCIFCPADVRMPKSYLADEPGAQRAANNAFDPYLQTYNRLLTLRQNGHDTSKIELIILGGTWSYYPERYQIWFVKGCFDALNDFGLGIDKRREVRRGPDFKDIEFSNTGLGTNYNQVVTEAIKKKQADQLFNSWETARWLNLERSQKANETSNCRCVGLVIETRPDNISEKEVVHVRRLGCTKTQIGVQSLSDRVLRLNRRGHDVDVTKKAFRLLREAGFKIHAHWMPNLYGSTPEKDISDYKKLFSDPDFKPDELKIYPCSLIASAELMTYYQSGKWGPYTEKQLLHVLSECLTLTPPYCRISRMVRDISSTDIVAGNKKTNFRQLVEQHVKKSGRQINEIRFREIKSHSFNSQKLKLSIVTYNTAISTEKFLQYITPDGNILAFLRLSLPDSPKSKLKESTDNLRGINQELQYSAIIREVHVYGPAVRVGDESKGKPQHLGLGRKLIRRAVNISRMSGYMNLAVISAVGTREYYRKLGFVDGTYYQHAKL